MYRISSIRTSCHAIRSLQRGCFEQQPLREFHSSRVSHGGRRGGSSALEPTTLWRKKKASKYNKKMGFDKKKHGIPNARRIAERQSLKLASMYESANALSERDEAAEYEKMMGVVKELVEAPMSVDVPVGLQKMLKFDPDEIWDNAVKLSKRASADPALAAKKFIFAIRVLCAHRRFDEALLIVLPEMRERKLPIHPDTYGALLQGAAYNRRRDAIDSIWKDMRVHNVVPDARTWFFLMEALARNRRTDDCIEAGKAMRAAGLKFERNHYVAQLRALVFGNRHDDVWKLWEEMIENGIPGDHASCTLLVDSCARSGEFEKAMKIVDEMESRDLAPTRTTFNNLLKACSTTALWMMEYGDMVEKIRQRMSGYGYTPDNHTFQALMLCYGRCGDTDSLEKVVAEMHAWSETQQQEKNYEKYKKLALGGGFDSRSNGKNAPYVPRLNGSINSIEPENEYDSEHDSDDESHVYKADLNTHKDTHRTKNIHNTNDHVNGSKNSSVYSAGITDMFGRMEGSEPESMLSLATYQSQLWAYAGCMSCGEKRGTRPRYGMLEDHFEHTKKMKEEYRSIRVTDEERDLLEGIYNATVDYNRDKEQNRLDNKKPGSGRTKFVGWEDVPEARDEESIRAYEELESLIKARADARERGEIVGPFDFSGNKTIAAYHSKDRTLNSGKKDTKRLKSGNTSDGEEEGDAIHQEIMDLAEEIKEGDGTGPYKLEDLPLLEKHLRAEARGDYTHLLEEQEAAGKPVSAKLKATIAYLKEKGERHDGNVREYSSEDEQHTLDEFEDDIEEGTMEFSEETGDFEIIEHKTSRSPELQAEIQKRKNIKERHALDSIESGNIETLENSVVSENKEERFDGDVPEKDIEVDGSNNSVYEGVHVHEGVREHAHGEVIPPLGEPLDPQVEAEMFAKFDEFAEEYEKNMHEKSIQERQDNAHVHANSGDPLLDKLLSGEDLEIDYEGDAKQNEPSNVEEHEEEEHNNEDRISLHEESSELTNEDDSYSNELTLLDRPEDDPFFLARMPLEERQEYILAYAEQAYDTAVSVYGPPNIQTLNSMLSVFCEGTKSDLATAFLREEYPRNSIKPDRRTAQLVVRMFCRMRRPQDAVTMEQVSREEWGLSADWKCLGLILNEWSKRDNHEMMKDTLDKMQAANIVPSEKYMYFTRRNAIKAGFRHDWLPADPHARMRKDRAALKMRRKPDQRENEARSKAARLRFKEAQARGMRMY